MVQAQEEAHSLDLSILLDKDNTLLKSQVQAIHEQRIATEWNTVSDSHILFKSMPEGEFGRMYHVEKYKTKEAWQAFD